MGEGSMIWKRVKEEEEDANSILEQEEALVALIEHRTKEVEHLRQRISYYQSQLAEAEKRLQDSQSKLAHLRGRHISSLSNASLATKRVKLEQGIVPPERIDGDSDSLRSRTKLLIPSVIPKIPQPIKPEGLVAKTIIGLEETASSNREVKVKAEESERRSTDMEVVEVKDRGTKRKLEQKEHKELITLVESRSSPTLIGPYSSNIIPSQHKRKLRSLSLCPVNDQLFITSALDGLVNLWKIQGRGSSASLLSTTNCVSSGGRRWPEDIAWHPHRNKLFSVYTADAGDSQISVLNLNKKGRPHVTFLEDKPHVKGIINSIAFMPWEDTCFGTGGSDHAVVLWSERDENVWKPKTLHRNLHSSAVMGVAGMQQKQIVLSAGADKRIIGFDVVTESADFKHQMESKCMSVLPNPCDFNLFMVQTGVHERQIRLYDVRSMYAELHSFGWKQDSSESHSALINQAWSPDGLYLSSGSADPVIHIFDIRYNACRPSQSIRAHQKRVFKAVWHNSLPLLISISSDLQIGLHKE
ncbi:APO protein 3 [Hibiscus syriacus]|uniref:APO protein 3 n=1 Tax=Hibiscus syriacus TaxID=106335 RepID=A0A6A2ZSK1_HIBSY|nr:U5 small nuclear ribonucleoprotein 40 kDa protein-like [Hibiscus syriacus]KAE8694526.1 APO protein 3 [Hibiscus syriacus]